MWLLLLCYHNKLYNSNAYLFAHHIDYFGIESDQKDEEIKRQEAKHKALTGSKNFIDDQYFSDNDGNSELSTVKSSSSREFLQKNSSKKVAQFDFNELSEIDSQYFGSVGSNSNVAESLNPIISPLLSSKPVIIKNDRRPFPTPTVTAPKNNFNRKKSKLDSTIPVRDPDNLSQQNDILEELNENDDDGEADTVEYGSDAVRIVRQRTKLNLYTGTTLDIPSHNKQSSSIPEKLDSQGHRVPDEDPLKFNFLTEEEAATALYKSIIEIRENVIVMNKPRGIASQPGPDCKYNIIDLLPRIELMVRKGRTHRDDNDETKKAGELSLVHRLDKDSTGVMLIARNKDAALKSEYGYIQLPLTERNFNGIRKLCAPVLNRHVQEMSCKETQSEIDNNDNNDDITDAFSLLHNKMLINKNPITWYHMLDRRNDAALLLCSTLTGIKHQVRAHLAFGLQTPILGDHKYSHAEYLAPQRLPKKLLEALNIRQSKVRYLSLHLHASNLHLCISPSSSSVNNQGFFDFIRSRDEHLSCISAVNHRSMNNPQNFMHHYLVIFLII
ncbi:unnamed protein product [Heterobilharzia americana]|nr:unnamed protein product [Heterobilharzia americana]